MVVDRNILIARSILHLQKLGIILYIVDFNPTRDYFHNWVYDVISIRMWIDMKQIEELSRFAF